MKQLLITGAAGHLGFELATQLLRKDYKVTASVRKPSPQSVELARRGATIIYLDLLDPAKVDEAIRGMDAVFQVAAVFDLTAKDPERQVVAPNLAMTENVLRACAKHSVAKLIYTSSIAAIGTTSGQPRGESDWNLNSPEPYARSKALSEKLAWQLSKELGVEMVTVLPGTIWGPGGHHLTSSMQFIANIVSGDQPFAINSELSLVDIRDVAEAHIRVFESDNAKGRYIATHNTWSMRRIHQELLSIDSGLKTSAKVAPNWVARMFPALDWLKALITRSDRTITRAVIREYLGKKQLFDMPRLRTELGWSPRDTELTVADSLAWTRDFLGGELKYLPTPAGASPSAT
ncbi:MAG: dihydroflavonol-4-reductase [Planctomycetota bacterium]|jgi:dihydroflavonol-4-reductase